MAFETLPNELVANICAYVYSVKDLYNLALSSKHTFAVVAHHCSRFSERRTKAVDKWVLLAEERRLDYVKDTHKVMKLVLRPKQKSCLICSEKDIYKLDFGTYGIKGNTVRTKCKIVATFEENEFIAQFHQWIDSCIWFATTNLGNVFILNPPPDHIFLTESSFAIPATKVKLTFATAEPEQFTIMSIDNDICRTREGDSYQVNRRPIGAQWFLTKFSVLDKPITCTQWFDTRNFITQFILLDAEGGVSTTRLLKRPREHVGERFMDTEPVSEPAVFQSRVNGLFCSPDLPYYLTDEDWSLHYFRKSHSDDIRVMSVDFFKENKIRIIRAVVFANQVAAISADYNLFVWQHLGDGTPTKIEKHLGPSRVEFIDVTPVGYFDNCPMFQCHGIGGSTFLLKRSDSNTSSLLQLS